MDFAKEHPFFFEAQWFKDGTIDVESTIIEKLTIMQQHFDDCFAINQAAYVAAMARYGKEYQAWRSSGIAESAIPPFTMKPPSQVDVLSSYRAEKIKPSFLGLKFLDENGPQGSEIGRKLLAG